MGRRGGTLAGHPCFTLFSPTQHATPQTTTGRGTGGGYTDIRVVVYITPLYPEKTKKGAVIYNTAYYAEQYIDCIYI